MGRLLRSRMLVVSVSCAAVLLFVGGAADLVFKGRRAELVQTELYDIRECIILFCHSLPKLWY